MNLPSPPLPRRAPTRRRNAGGPFTSAFTNAPFRIDDYIAPTDTTCPPTRRRVRAAERRGSNGDRARRAAAPATSCTASTRSSTSSTAAAQDRYVTGSDAIGPDDGQLRHARRCRSTSTCTRRDTRTTRSRTTSSRRAFGGSFLNHQWLIAAATPVDPERRTGRRQATCTRCSTRTGCRTTTRSTRRPLGTPVNDRSSTPVVQLPAGPSRPPLQTGLACGNYARQHDPAAVPAVLGLARPPSCRRRPRPTIGDG